MDVAGAAVLVSYWYDALHNKHASISAPFTTMTLTGKVGRECCAVTGSLGSLFDEENDGTGEKRRRRDRSRQDLIAIYLPYMVLPAAVPIGACYVYRPKLKFLLYSCLPDDYQNWLTFALCLVEEMWFLMVILGLITPAYQTQLISYELIAKKLQDLVQSEQQR